MWNQCLRLLYCAPVLLLCGGLLLFGCPDSSEPTACQKSSDCEADALCVGSKCRAKCNTDRDCDKGEECLANTKVCVPEGGSPPDGGGEPAPDKGTLPDNTPATCGNGQLDPGETCDGEDLRGSDCKSLGFAGGSLSCNKCQLDSSGCSSNPNCGNGKLDPGETCDGSDLKGQTCKSVGFTSGDLTCKGCQVDTSSCSNKSPNCGNATVDPDEDCDGQDLKGQTCQAKGFLGGDLACKDCQFDTSACTKAGQKEFGEKCKFQEECSSLICTRFNPTTDPFGYCGAKCGTTACPTTPAGAECVFTVGATKLCGWKCTGTGGACPAGLTCVPYAGGNFCGASEAAPPTGKCGDNKGDAGEECDGQDLKGKTCQDFGFTGGGVTCTAGCKIDTSQCTGGTSKKKFGNRCTAPTDCEAGLICLQIQGGTGMFCTTKCDSNPCPTTPANAACILQTAQGKFCGWLCAGGLKCPTGLTCTNINGSMVCS